MKGGCLCGAVRYEVGGDMLFGGNCYCVDCRKTTSSHSASMAVLEATVKITGAVSSYSSPGGSGNEVTRMFCATCGTGLFSKGVRPGVMMVRAGTLDDVELYKPMASIYVSRAPTWDRPPTDLPAFPEMPPQG
jgi:hypothetical protein